MKEIFYLVGQMAPYLLLGFLLAGVMHAFVPQRLYRRYLGGNSFRSVVNATLLGIPLPLCSCGVIPTAMSLRKEGASDGATTAFLIATPQTGVDSIFATYSLMGLPFALLRPVAALATSLMGGALAIAFSNDEHTETKNELLVKEKQISGFIPRVKSALRYAFVEMMQDIGRWLVIGLVVAGLITVYVPDSFFSYFADNSLLSMLLVLVCAVPMYLCATGSIPIAVALMLKGLSPGTALVLLMAGPAVNVASILVINKVLGFRSMLIYLASVIFGAIAFALCVDYLLPREWFIGALVENAACHTERLSYFSIGCSILLAILLVNALVRRFVVKKSSCQSGECVCQNSVVRLKVVGMRCNHCCANVQKALSSVEGVVEAEVDLASGEAIIKGEADVNKLRAAVEALGFKVE